MTDLEIGLTDYEKPMLCGGCGEWFTVGETLYVADFEAVFPTFCSESCSIDKAEEYRVEHLVDDNDGVEFVRLIERFDSTGGGKDE